MKSLRQHRTSRLAAGKRLFARIGVKNTRDSSAIPAFFSLPRTKIRSPAARLPLCGAALKYKYYLLDADETLFDFQAAQRIAIKQTLQGVGLPDGEDRLDAFGQINARLWRLREKGEITQEELLVRRFRELLGGEDETLIQSAAQGFTDNLSRQGMTFPGAGEVVREIAKRGGRIAIVTNGVAHTQKGRMAQSGFEDCIDELIISEEVGVHKPDPAMVHIALARLGCHDPAQAVMVGDNPDSDILAGQRAGVDTCWYNPARETYPLKQAPTHTIASLEELLALA